MCSYSLGLVLGFRVSVFFDFIGVNCAELGLFLFLLIWFYCDCCEFWWDRFAVDLNLIELLSIYYLMTCWPGQLVRLFHEYLLPPIKAYAKKSPSVFCGEMNLSPHGSIGH